MRSILAFVLLISLSVTGAHAAGLQSIEVRVAERSRPLQGAIWYPCNKTPEIIRLRRARLPGVRDCPVAGENLPLVVMSHGAHGWFGGHHDTAAVLADAGYVVAAITHPDEPDQRWFTERPAAIARLIDTMLEDWPEHSRLDPNRIGFFGYSRGGYTGLVLIGGEPDFQRMENHCNKRPDDFMCTLHERTMAQSTATTQAPQKSFVHDARIRAAVLAAPSALVFPQKSIADIDIPVQLWRPEEDALLLFPYHAEALNRALPKPADYRVIPDAGHYAILMPCDPGMANARPGLCEDAPNFDRAAFHEFFSAEILAFFNAHLN